MLFPIYENLPHKIKIFIQFLFRNISTLVLKIYMEFTQHISAYWMLSTYTIN